MRNHSQMRIDFLRKEAVERQEVRNSRSSVDQLQVISRRGVPVPGTTVKDVKKFVKASGFAGYCREVVRLMKQISGRDIEPEASVPAVEPAAAEPAAAEPAACKKTAAKGRRGRNPS